MNVFYIAYNNINFNIILYPELILNLIFVLFNLFNYWNRYY